MEYAFIRLTRPDSASSATWLRKRCSRAVASKSLLFRIRASWVRQSSAGRLGSPAADASAWITTPLVYPCYSVVLRSGFCRTATLILQSLHVCDGVTQPAAGRQLSQNRELALAACPGQRSTSSSRYSAVGYYVRARPYNHIGYMLFVDVPPELPCPSRSVAFALGSSLAAFEYQVKTGASLPG